MFDIRLYILALGFLIFPFCKSDKNNLNTKVEEPTLTADNPVLKLLAPEQTGIDFQNQIIETYENNITTNINMYNGGGMAIADINNDNLPDVYFGCSNGKNRLYLNLGNMKFKDITDESGLASEEGFETAITAVDINEDGFLDFYICRGGKENNEHRRNKLFINNGLSTNSSQNTTSPSPSGEGRGGVVAGSVSFTEKSKEYGLDDQSASTGANFFDYDQDGDLDLYLLNYPTEAIYTNKIESRLAADGKTYEAQLYPRDQYDSDRLYRNEGGKFTDISKQAGIWNLAYGLSVSVSDFNHDGYPDVYVGNDFIQPDLLYINNKNGTFTNRLSEYFSHTSQHTMGTDITDFDNDGWVDLFAVDMLAANNFRRKTFMATNTISKYTSMVQHGYFEPVVQNVLQRNNGYNSSKNGGTTFSDVACITGVFQTDWSWSGLLADFDNDGLRDLHVTNGYRREVTNRDFIDYTLPNLQKEGGGKRLRDIYPDFNQFLSQVPEFKVRNFLYQNKGDLKFDDVSGKWATMPAAWSCGSAWSDLDLDGDLDLITNNLENPAFVYENTTRGQNANATSGNNYLQIKLRGAPKNPFAVGASVAIYYGNGKQQYQEHYPTRGIFSSVEHLVHFGLGGENSVQKLVIRWPDGKTQTLENVPVNQRLTPNYADASGKTAYLLPPPPSRIFLNEKTATAGTQGFSHWENPYNDFEQFFMNPWKVTDLGPYLAKGDVNGDGLEDFFVGSGFDHAAAVFLQKTGGTFAASKQAAIEADKLYEDAGAVFFDADGDKDLDLFVNSGGIEATNPAAWQSRLYLNDGKGNFAKSPNPMPKPEDISGRALAADLDGDGDQDLLIGGRVTPLKWPTTPKSRVFRNDGGGKFSDATALMAGDFERCGMVTDLKWLNLDSDPANELVVVGEWMPVSVFKMSGGKLQNVTAQFGFDKSNGIWYRLETADLDGDGDQDLLTGNLGLNTRYTAGNETPLRLFAADFDKNNILDPILCYYENGKIYPYVQKDVLNKQMPILKKKFLYAKEYGNATISDLWPQNELDKAQNLYAYTLETCWWENQGGKFVKRILPRQAQVSTAQGIVVSDFDGDDANDILISGNKYGFEVETSRCDNGTGCLLLGDGKGNFTWVANEKSGFFASKEGRDMIILNGKTVVVGNNNAGLQIFERKGN